MKKTSISIVGSGNVATHLAIALHNAGHTIRQVLSREFDHASLLASRVGAVPVNQLTLLSPDADVYILAVGDDSIYDLALDLRLPDTAMVVHTSGSTPMSVLRGVCKRHGVLWSPQTFIKDIAIDYSRLPLCIEAADEATLRDLEALARSISQTVYHLDYEQRRWAHLAAVMVNNFVNAVNATAQQVMASHGLDFEMLKPLAEETLRKWDYGDLRTMQTGPAIRHDTKTLASQRRLLSDNPRLLQLYDIMTNLIQQP